MKKYLHIFFFKRFIFLIDGWVNGILMLLLYLIGRNGSGTIRMYPLGGDDDTVIFSCFFFLCTFTGDELVNSFMIKGLNDVASEVELVITCYVYEGKVV